VIEANHPPRPSRSHKYFIRLYGFNPIAASSGERRYQGSFRLICCRTSTNVSPSSLKITDIERHDHGLHHFFSFHRCSHAIIYLPCASFICRNSKQLAA
jgi:hypothetical protein